MNWSAAAGVTLGLGMIVLLVVLGGERSPLADVGQPAVLPAEAAPRPSGVGRLAVGIARVDDLGQLLDAVQRNEPPPPVEVAAPTTSVTGPSVSPAPPISIAATSTSTTVEASTTTRPRSSTTIRDDPTTRPPTTPRSSTTRPAPTTTATTRPPTTPPTTAPPTTPRPTTTSTTQPPTTDTTPTTLPPTTSLPPEPDFPILPQP